MEQVSVESNNYSAELGNVAGAIVNMVIKSGTNQFHGNAFEYWRDNKLAATPWATNRAGGQKAGFSRDLFGGTVGGPLLRNRVFFFANYQGGRQDSPLADSFATVVPNEWRQGDLSSLLARNIIIRDPLTGQPFPNNQIPLSRFSNFARNLFADETLYPRSNVTRPLSDFRQNYRGQTGSNQQVDQVDVKFDWNASATDKLYVRYSRQAFEQAPLATVMPLSFSSAANNPFWGMSANWNRIFGNAIVNDLLVGINDSSSISDPIDLLGLGKLNNQLGIAGDQAVRGLTNIRWGNDLTEIGSAETGTNNANTVYQINERLTWLLGRHTLKFGGSWNYYQSDSEYPGNNGRNGFIAYNQFNFTGAPFADFLLDQVSHKGRGSVTEAWTHLQHRTSLYAADDFKVTDTLTLNLGMRWAYTSPFVEKDDRQSNFDLTNGQIQLAGQNGNSRALYEPFYGGWEPRIGLAYRMSERWVFRGGYGIAQYMEGTGANLRLPLNPPFFFESEVRYDSTSGPGTVATGFVGLQALDAISGQLRAWDPALRPQFTQQWNVFAEYLIGPRSSINVGYVANKSTQLVTPIDGNQPLPGHGRPGHLAAGAAAPSPVPLQPVDHVDQHDGIARAERLQRAAVDVQAAAVAGAGLRRQLHPGQGDGEQLGLLRQRGCGGRGRIPDEQLRHRGQLWPGRLRRAARLLDGRQLRDAVRPRAAVRQRLEPCARCGRGRVVGELRGHGPYRVPDHGDRRREPLAPGVAIPRAAQSHRRRRSGQPDARALDRSSGV